MKPDAIERTVEKTNIWLHDIGGELRTKDERVSYHALRAVLHAIRDRLSVDDAAALGAQLPLLVRGIYYEGWHPAGKPLRVRKAEEFLVLLAGNLAQDVEDQLDPQRALNAVFGTLQAHADPGAIDKVIRAFPPDIQCLLPCGVGRTTQTH